MLLLKGVVLIVGGYKAPSVSLNRSAVELERISCLSLVNTVQEACGTVQRTLQLVLIAQGRLQLARWLKLIDRQ